MAAVMPLLYHLHAEKVASTADEESVRKHKDARHRYTHHGRRAHTLTGGLMLAVRSERSITPIPARCAIAVATRFSQSWSPFLALGWCDVRGFDEPW